MNNVKTTLKQKNYRKFILPAGIALFAFILVEVITSNPPEAKRGKPDQTPQITVAAKTLAPQSYQVMVQSFGTVTPRTESVLYSQVSGQINKVSEQFRAGGFFKKGDVLVQLDDRDYRAEVNIAKASYVSATQSLQEEQARVKQAKADWERLGNGSSASALVLRKPQLEAAEAAMLSAQAQLDKANLALERTKVVAPYSGRILAKNVDLGQVVSSNTALANIYATDKVEVRLPIKNKDLALVNLPEEFEDSVKVNAENKQSNVKLESDLFGAQQWPATLVRTEGAIDSTSQQLYVVAEIQNPFDRQVSQNGQIKIGQYVTAQIVGKVIENALVIPSSSIYQGSYVYTVTNDGLLKRVDIKLGWQNGLEAIVTEGLNTGDKLVLTSLGQVHSGTPVLIEGQSKKAKTKKIGVVGKKGDRPLDSMPKERREKLEQMAKEKGITVEELMAQRKDKKGER